MSPASFANRIKQIRELLRNDKYVINSGEDFIIYLDEYLNTYIKILPIEDARRNNEIENVIKLIEEIKEEVKKKYDIDLKYEINIIK